MKRKTFKAIALASVLGIAGAALPASASEVLRVKVPFPFVLAGQEFSAGQYRVDQSDSGLIIVQGEGHAVAVLSIPADLPNGPTHPRSTSRRVTAANIWWVYKSRAKAFARSRVADSRNAS